MKPNCNICNNSAKCELLIENIALNQALEKAKQRLRNEDICGCCIHIDNEELSEACQGCRDHAGAPNWEFNDSLLSVNKEAEASNEAKPNTEAELINYLEKLEQWEARWIQDSKSWTEGLPSFSREIYEGWLELQSQRIKLLSSMR